MKNQNLIILTAILFISCSELKKEKNLVEEVEIANNQDVVEIISPEGKKIVEYDTIISERNLRISILSEFLDSYVTNEFDNEGIKHIVKYRDSEKHLVIEDSKGILVDTVFKKADFVDLAGQDFLKIANFHGYWFEGIKNNTVKLFGVISKPDTDWSFAFYHYFDLASMTFKVEEHIDE